MVKKCNGKFYFFKNGKVKVGRGYSTKEKAEAFGELFLMREEYKDIASELCYPKSCLNELNKAKTDFECGQIMTKYRLSA